MDLKYDGQCRFHFMRDWSDNILLLPPVEKTNQANCTKQLMEVMKTCLHLLENLATVWCLLIMMASKIKLFFTSLVHQY
ncbi:uncharacterized protein RHIMIDRAFT_270685 [Rhizopus microsporus ATCC 52813]|uniref:Uncharacterized protein n=2 Tax=Rhizopus microsporus TaxID=58291 RepID=A0A2G4SGN1_RHIZD|nr:uncharacterized protein RHIMIDRAFT_270685 [Rhizopus microsporus ATCC 52813]PHZ07927.1 hypothetical protein RHIMIDRAFT_270685 [Rhizopus microsporus ATCC 52813]